MFFQYKNVVSFQMDVDNVMIVISVNQILVQANCRDWN